MDSASIWNGLKVGCVAIALLCSQAIGAERGIMLDSLSPDEVDLFDFDSVPGDYVLFGMTTPLSGLGGGLPTDEPDTTVATFAKSDVTFASPYTFNALSGAGDNVLGALDGALFRFQAPTTGDYTVGVTGDGDEFDGFGHAESGDYLFTYAKFDPSSSAPGDFADTDTTNDAPTGADTLSLGTVDAQFAINTLATGGDDVDWYTIDLKAGDIFTAITAPLDDLSTSFDFPDTYMAVFAPGMVEIAANEDAGGIGEAITYPASVGSDSPGLASGPTAFGSAVKIEAPVDGTYYLAVSGFGDTGFEGGHDESGDYGLLVSRYVPEPGSLALLGVGGLALVRRRVA